MRHGASAVLLIVLAAPGAGQSDDPRPTATRAYRVVAGDTLRAHVFQPAGRRSGAAILLFHGGGWTSGAPDWTFATARRFADSGLVAIAIQYRLSDGDVTPLDALGDACAALAWTWANARDLGLTGRIAGFGVSAGAHLIAATATVGCPGGVAGPDALLLWSPALDVTHDRWFGDRLRGRATAADLSPARHVRATTPPTSIVHGERDTLTPLAGARRYCAALTALGGVCELHAYPGVGHLLTRNLANQESDFDPDPGARADGIARHHRFLRRMGFVR